jgi:hypothetical protein
MTNRSRTALVSLAALVLGACKPAPNDSAPEPPQPAEAGEPAPGLQIFPTGDVFPFMGYSGAPQREALHGFTVAGPNYGRSPEQRAAWLAKCEQAGLPTPWLVGLDMNFHAKPPARPLALERDEIKRRVAAQVREVADHPLICWWYVTPEELRPWRKNETDYLSAVTEAIRETDPHNRPVWMYDPNHRTSEPLVGTGRHLDLVGKGCYTNLAGFQRERIWVRWSIEQEAEAIKTLAGEDSRLRHPLLLPELCADPQDPADDHLIPAWVRHDVYLGLISGARGVAIWSLFPRSEVKRTWALWYDAYARLADELCGPLDLGRVFLCGKTTTQFPISVLDGPREVELFTGPRNQLEDGTLSEQDRQRHTHKYPALSVAEIEHQGSTWIFLCNSHPTETVKYQSEPLPEGATATDLFTRNPTRRNGAALYGWLGPLQVLAIRIDLP